MSRASWCGNMSAMCRRAVLMLGHTSFHRHSRLAVACHLRLEFAHHRIEVGALRIEPLESIQMHIKHLNELCELTSGSAGALEGTPLVAPLHRCG